MDDPAALVERAMVALRHLQGRRTLSRLAQQRLGVFDAAFFGVLDTVDEASRRGLSCTISYVARALHVDQPRASKLVAQAVASGLVSRQADQSDGRKSVLVLTSLGLAQIGSMHAFRRSVFAEAMDGWSDGDRETFGRLLTRFASQYESVVLNGD